MRFAGLSAKESVLPDCRAVTAAEKPRKAATSISSSFSTVSVHRISRYTAICSPDCRTGIAPAAFFPAAENWKTGSPSDLFQFYFDTELSSASLDFLRNLLSREAVERAVRIGACNLYHGCVHNMVHERDPEILSALYKSAVFLLQAVCFRGTGLYLKKRADLRKNVSGREREILDIAEERKREKSLPEMNDAAEAAEKAEMMAEMAETAESGSEKRKEQFERQSELLFLWAQQLLLDFSGRKASENS